MQRLPHPIYKAKSLQIEGPYRVRFDDATEQAINSMPILSDALYGPLRDQAVFEQVQIDPDVNTLVPSHAA
jgi:hypothetical protein